jgi:predicted DNA-binding transcriptional regulator AlpA
VGNIKNVGIRRTTFYRYMKAGKKPSNTSSKVPAKRSTKLVKPQNSPSL